MQTLPADLRHTCCSTWVEKKSSKRLINNYSNKGKLRTNGSFIEDHIAKTLSGTMQISGKYDVELIINFTRSNNTWTGTATANGVDVSEVFKRGFLD